MTTTGRTPAEAWECLKPAAQGDLALIESAFHRVVDAVQAHMNMAPGTPMPDSMYEIALLTAQEAVDEDNVDVHAMLDDDVYERYKLVALQAARDAQMALSPRPELGQSIFDPDAPGELPTAQPPVDPLDEAVACVKRMAEMVKILTEAGVTPDKALETVERQCSVLVSGPSPTVPYSLNTRSTILGDQIAHSASALPAHWPPNGNAPHFGPPVSGIAGAFGATLIKPGG